ncbi:MAG: TrkH family potassium uptake protein [Prevotellaceae bacterium]|nr:TrkH family potassium uptake protein [Prevotellaceae bacterium]
MINWKIIFKVIGQLLFIEAFMMLICCGVASYCHADDMAAFLISAVLTIMTGSVLQVFGRNATNMLSRRDAYLVVTLTWLIFSLFGSLPFIISGYLPNFTDAYFETMSGFTTTGATVIDNVEILPHGLLFWRSFTHFIGGLGIVFFTIAILPNTDSGGLRLYTAESTGPLNTKLQPRLTTSAKWIWMIYGVLTASCIVAYYLQGMDLFDSINYALSTTATGGFSTHNSSTVGFHSPSLEYTCTIFMLLSSINFPLLYMAVCKGKIRDLFHNSEFRFFISLAAIFTFIIMIELIIHNGYTVEHAFRSGIFQVISFMSTTGLFNDDAAKWPHVTWVILAMCMFFGACSGSTCGGFKCVRGVMVLKIIKNQFRQMLHPNAVLPLKIDGVNVSTQKRVTLLAFLATYLILCLVISFTMIAMGIDNTNAITITLSALGNVGPSLGLEIGPTMSWSMLPAAAKWMCSIMMLLGRLEIFTVLILFTPQFWKGN